MITALVLVERDAEALALTLSALVAGVAQGILGDAVVLARRADSDVARIADATGATLRALAPGEDPWRAGAALARRDWLLMLAAGDVPSDGWIRAVERFVATVPATAPPIARLTRRGGPASARLATLVGGLVGWSTPRAGDLAHRSALGRRGRIVRLSAAVLRDGAF